jgi:pentatricopeptide repeat protein
MSRLTDLKAMLARLEAMEREGRSVLQLLEAVNLQPRTDLRGGDWRYISFNALNVDDHDFRDCRLFGATFLHASVANAHFRGADSATPIRGNTGLFAARNWNDADLDDHQRLALRYRAHLQEPQKEPLPVAEFIEAGLLNDRNYLDFMRKSDDYDAARKIYDLMKEQGVAPNQYAITELIVLARNDDPVIKGLYQEALLDRVPIDDVLLNAMADCFADDRNARSLRALFRANNLPVGEFYFNILIKRARGQADAEDILAEMAESDVTASNVTLSSIASTNAATKSDPKTLTPCSSPHPPRLKFAKRWTSSGNITSNMTYRHSTPASTSVGTSGRQSPSSARRSRPSASPTHIPIRRC